MSCCGHANGSCFSSEGEGVRVIYGEGYSPSGLEDEFDAPELAIDGVVFEGYGESEAGEVVIFFFLDVVIVFAGDDGGVEV